MKRLKQVFSLYLSIGAVFGAVRFLSATAFYWLGPGKAITSQISGLVPKAIFYSVEYLGVLAVILAWPYHAARLTDGFSAFMASFFYHWYQ